VREGVLEGLADAGDFDGDDVGALPVVGVGEGGTGGGEDGVGWVGLVGCGVGFEVGDGGGVGDGLDADLGVEVEGGGSFCGDDGDGLAGSDEGPAGGEGVEVGDGFEAGLVFAVGVVGVPLLAGLVEEDANAGLAEVVGFAGGGGFEDADEGGLGGGCGDGGEQKREEGEGSWLHGGISLPISGVGWMLDKD
jgi:hypothetical protein